MKFWARFWKRPKAARAPEPIKEIREAQSDWNHRLAEWRAGRAIRCQECLQIELPGEPRHFCTNPNPPIHLEIDLP